MSPHRQTQTLLRIGVVEPDGCCRMPGEVNVTVASQTQGTIDQPDPGTWRWWTNGCLSKMLRTSAL